MRGQIQSVGRRSAQKIERGTLFYGQEGFKQKNRALDAHMKSAAGLRSSAALFFYNFLYMKTPKINAPKFTCNVRSSTCAARITTPRK